jgi:predicted permease
MASIDSAIRDLRHTVRLLVTARGFTLAAVTALGLGIGANAAVFSVVKTTLIESMPYGAPDRLVLIWNPADPRGTTHLSVRELVSYGEAAESFERVAGYTETSANLSGDDAPERVPAGVVTADLFDALGVPPLLGRTFAADEGQPGGAPVVMIAHGLWERRFGGARDVIGRPMLVNGLARTVVGVMPAGFRLPLDYRAERSTEVWWPLVVDRANLGAWGSRSSLAVARLKPGVDPASATSELTVITAGWVRAGFEGFRGGVGPREAVSVQRVITGPVRTPLLVLAGSDAAVLLIACANVINLLLARGEIRRREIAIRAAVGAARRHLVGLLISEAAVLSILGVTCGLIVADIALRLLLALRPATLPRLDEVALDRGVLAFTAALGVLSTVLFSVAPAVQLLRPNLAGILQDWGRGASGGLRGRTVRGALVVVQLASSVVLVIGAGLLVRTLVALYRVDLGFDPRGVLTAQLPLSPADYPSEDRVVMFYREVTARIQQLPGVRQAGAVRVLPLARSIGDYSITIEGRPTRPSENPNADFQWVTPGYFPVMGLTLLHGRVLTDGDREDMPLVVVINDTMAARYWPGEDALGRRFHMGGSTDRPPLTIVGIVRGTRHNAVVESARAEMYLPHAQLPRSVGGAARSMALVVKTEGDPLQHAGPVRDVVRGMDRNLPLAEVHTMEQIAAATLATPRFAALLLGVSAALALGLAAIGTYATIAVLVAERSLEIGIRMALGAAPSGVLRLVLRDGLVLTATGLAAGLAGALILSRFLEALLFGVRPFDPATFASVSLVLAMVGLVASVLPARRAAAADPVEILRRG